MQDPLSWDLVEHGHAKIRVEATGLLTRFAEEAAELTGGCARLLSNANDRMHFELVGFVLLHGFKLPISIVALRP